MEPELKALLSALLEGQVKLGEGQARTDAIMRELAAAQLRTDAAVRDLAGAQLRTEQALKLFTERVDRMSESMIRGFNQVSTRQTQAEDRLDKLEGQ